MGCWVEGAARVTADGRSRQRALGAAAQKYGRDLNLKQSGIAARPMTAGAVTRVWSSPG